MCCFHSQTGTLYVVAKMTDNRNKLTLGQFISLGEQRVPWSEKSIRIWILLVKLALCVHLWKQEKTLWYWVKQNFLNKTPKEWSTKEKWTHWNFCSSLHSNLHPCSIWYWWQFLLCCDFLLLLYQFILREAVIYLFLGPRHCTREWVENM